MSDLDKALTALAESESAWNETSRAREVARANRNDAVDRVVDEYLSLYHKLPIDVRNKVRHAINTEAKT